MDDQEQLHVVFMDYIPRVGDLIEFIPFGNYLTTRVSHTISTSYTGLVYNLKETTVYCAKVLKVEQPNPIKEPWQSAFEDVIKSFEGGGYRIIPESAPWKMLQLAASLGNSQCVTEENISELQETIKKVANLHREMERNLSILLGNVVTPEIG